MLYWYQTRSGLLPGELSVKFDLVKNALFQKPTDVAFLRLILPTSTQNSEDAVEILQNFWYSIKTEWEISWSSQTM